MAPAEEGSSNILLRFFLHAFFFHFHKQKKCLSATCVALQICWFQNIFNRNMGCSVLGQLKHTIHRPHQLGLMRSHNLIKWVLIAFPAICCTLQEVYFPLCGTLSVAFSVFCHLSRAYLIGPLPPPPPPPFLPYPTSFFPQGDRGGRLTLQKRWTSFLKARLMCSLPEYDFHFNMLRSVFVMQGHMPQDTLFYGIFGLEWWVSVVKPWLARGLRYASTKSSETKMKGADQYIERRQEGMRWKAKGKRKWWELISNCLWGERFNSLDS